MLPEVYVSIFKISLFLKNPKQTPNQTPSNILFLPPIPTACQDIASDPPSTESDLIWKVYTVVFKTHWFLKSVKIKVTSFHS